MCWGICGLQIFPLTQPQHCLKNVFCIHFEGFKIRLNTLQDKINFLSTWISIMSLVSCLPSCSPLLIPFLMFFGAFFHFQLRTPLTFTVSDLHQQEDLRPLCPFCHRPTLSFLIQKQTLTWGGGGISCHSNFNTLKRSPL